MKAFICEMCNSRDMLKDGDYIICQSCGTKYAIEEAKKMMVEVEGTVKIDRSDVLKNSIANARRAKQKEDWEETEKYYNLVEQNDPSNIEAIFYSAYAKARTTLPVNEFYKREAVFKAFVKSIDIIDENYDVSKAAELQPIIEQIVTDCSNLMGVEFVYTQTKNGYGIVTGDDKGKTYQLFINSIATLYDSLENILKNKLQNADNKQKSFLMTQQLRLIKRIINSSAVKNSGRETFCNIYQKKAEELCAIDGSKNMSTYLADIEGAKESIKSDSRKGIAKIIGAIALGLLIGIAYFVYWYVI